MTTPRALLLLAALSACAAQGPDTTPGASAQEIQSCKQSCDKMKFFDCNSAAQLSACYSDCGQAQPDDIELFVACATSSICDPACRLHIEPAQDNPGPGSSVGASACGTACDKVIACSLLPLGAKDQCVATCEQQAYQDQLDCVARTSCDQIASVCAGFGGGTTTTTGSGGGGGGTGDDFAVETCQLACDSLSFFGCVSATDHAACRARCATAAAGPRDSFTSCANGAGGDCVRGDDCYAVFSQ